MHLAGSRPRLATAAVVGMVIVLVAGLLILRGISSASPAGRTIWQAITSGIDSEDMPVATALEAFAYLTGVDIPGVSVPTGARGDDTPTSATGALRWVRAHWPEVTPKQRVPIEAFLRGGPKDLRVPVTGPAGQPIAATDRVASLAAGLPAGVAPIRIDAATATVAEAIKADVLATSRSIAAWRHPYRATSAAFVSSTSSSRQPLSAIACRSSTTTRATTGSPRSPDSPPAGSCREARCEAGREDRTGRVVALLTTSLIKQQ